MTVLKHKEFGQFLIVIKRQTRVSAVPRQALDYLNLRYIHHYHLIPKIG